MFEQFSPAGKAVCEATRPLAISLGHNYVGTEHLLLALLEAEERSGDGPLLARGVTFVSAREQALAWLAGVVSEADSLRSLGVDPGAVATEAKTALGVEVRIQGLERPVEIALTPRVFKVLHLAVGIAATAPAEPRHLLQALLEEDGGLAVIVLDRLGVDLPALHEALSRE